MPQVGGGALSSWWNIWTQSGRETQAMNPWWGPRAPASFGSSPSWRHFEHWGMQSCCGCPQAGNRGWFAWWSCPIESPHPLGMLVLGEAHKKGLWRSDKWLMRCSCSIWPRLQCSENDLENWGMTMGQNFQHRKHFLSLFFYIFFFSFFFFPRVCKICLRNLEGLGQSISTLSS